MRRQVRTVVAGSIGALLVGVLGGPAAAHDGGEHTSQEDARADDVARSTDAEGTDAADPTTPVEAAISVASARATASEPTPRTIDARLQAPRHERPRTRYEMAGACYGIRAVPTGKWIRRGAGGPEATAGGERAAARFFFKATDLGSFMLYGTEADFLDGTDEAVTWAGEPSDSADWTVRRPLRNRFTFQVPDGYLTLAQGGSLSVKQQRQGRASTWRLERIGGCDAYPEAGVNIKGAPFKGVSSFQQAYGMTDAHTHGMAFEFLGGKVHCGKPWDRFGAPYALVDCDDHTATDGKGAILEAFLSGEPSHDPTGWPEFTDWPAPHSLTHEGTYYKWMERSWRGGLRTFTNLLVENNQLCKVYPLTPTNQKWDQAVANGKTYCDDMVSLKWQADDMRSLQDYVDAQYGGPGRGWYRIVKNPYQARRIINSGRLAVIMGIETSIPFECSVQPGLDGPEPKAGCDKESVKGWLDTVQKWGVRQMEIVNKFDNAFSGITGDAAETGLLVNSANFLETQSHWRMQTCDGTEPGKPELGDQVHDKDQMLALPGSPPEEFDSEQQDALFGAVAAVSGVSAVVPLYGPHHHCNQYGLSELGDFLVRELAKRDILFDPDHMSVKARKSSLDVMEELDYPGVLSSHSWSTPDAYPRIMELGGFIAPYAGDSAGFVDKWEKVQTWADPRYFFGIGYGADINGLGAQGDARNPGEGDDVDYPFTGLGGVRVGQQHSGERVYDINTDGVAHYGLYPDWLEDLRQQAGEPIVEDMSRGAEAYLLTWERAFGVSNDACREPALRKPRSAFKSLAKGTPVRRVLERAGQPNRRLGRTFTYCAKRNGDTVRMKLDFTARGRLTKVRG